MAGSSKIRFGLRTQSKNYKIYTPILLSGTFANDCRYSQFSKNCVHSKKLNGKVLAKIFERKDRKKERKKVREKKKEREIKEIREKEKCHFYKLTTRFEPICTS